MTRPLLNLLTFLSLLTFVATAWLWVRSRWHEDRVSRCIRGTRYRVVSAWGTVAVYSPPPAAPDPREAGAAEAAVAAIRNDQVFWDVAFFDGPGESNSYFVNAAFALHDTPAYAAWRLKGKGTVSPLLRALEDPDRFEVAHVFLWWLDRRRSRKDTEFPFRPIPGKTLGRNPDEWYARRGHAHAQTPWLEADYDGLTVTLSRWADHERVGAIGKDLDEHGLLGDADAAQIPRLRDQWHRRLDVAALSVKWSHVVFVALVVTGVQLALGVRRRARRARALRQRLCLVCGYDLRATPGRCPECGASASVSPTS